MESHGDTPHDLTTDLSGPVRILAQTFTHLVPGKDGTRTVDFAFDNRRCYLLIEASGDQEVPVLSCEWRGQTLESKPELAQGSKVIPSPGNGSYQKGAQTSPGTPRKDAKWLQDNLEPRFWSEIERLTQDMDERERLVAAGILKPLPDPMSQDLDDDPDDVIPIPPSEAKKYRKLAEELGRPVEELNIPWKEWKKFYEYNTLTAEEGWEYMTWEEWEKNMQTEN
ncbi:hypothetical protein H101_02291 [Trichophyton interdigitale H6]|nr:hypothetical protein H101_02291 [Trichophyton interdigitale H6]